MSLENFKISDIQITQNGVSSAPDKLTGTAAQNKEIFDKLIKTVVSKSINDIIDMLASSDGALSIGMSDIYGEQQKLNVFSAVEKVRRRIETEKSNKSVTDNHFKDVEYDETSGLFKFIRENGEEITIDTMLEKISINFTYDEENESIVIELIDGTTKTIPLSSFISETDYIDSDTIRFNVENHKVSAIVKYGSITDEHLSSTLKNTLISYVASAESFCLRAESALKSSEGYASDSEVSSTNAREYALQSKTYREQSEGYASASSMSKNAAENASRLSEQHAESSEAYSKLSQGFAKEAEKARNEAVEIAGFDPTNYVKNTDIAEINGDAGIVFLSSATYGLNLKDFDGIKRLVVRSATEGQVLSKASTYLPVTPSTVDAAVKAGLIDNEYTLTDEEKTSISHWLGGSMIKTGEYQGTGADDYGTSEINFPIEFSPSIMFLVYFESGEMQVAMLFKDLSSHGAYLSLSSSGVNTHLAGSIYMASNENDMNFRLVENGVSSFNLASHIYYYVAIGKGGK